MKQSAAMAHSEQTHARWMALALQQAELAAAAGEVPVGAVVVYEGRVIAQAYNQTLQSGDPTAHAEVLALRRAAQVLGNHRLNQCTLYVSLEPCAMCSGAVFQARLQAVVYGAQEHKTGAAGSVVDLFALPQLNHHTTIIGGILAEQSSQLLATFFAQRRAAIAHAQAQTMQRLSDAALRTPSRAFAADEPEGAYRNTLDSANGMRMHYLQQGPAHEPADTVWVLLHPLWHWSAWWLPLMQELVAQGQEVIAPDLIGWGRSDKPKRADWHTLERHVCVLQELLTSLHVQRCVLVCQDGSQVLAQALRDHLQRTQDGQAPQIEVRGVIELVCRETASVWPAPRGMVTQKTWRVESYLRSHWRTPASPNGPFNWDGLVREAAAPYPDAGHARNWASQCFVTPSAVGPRPPSDCQLEAHAQMGAKPLVQQLRIMAQTWSA